MGDYVDAISLYESAAKESPANALPAHVQIVNAYCALDRMDEARAANQRARALLRQSPSGDGTFAMPRAYFEQWLKWTGSGTW